MNPELPAHHVSPSMKVIMLVFAVVLIATLGWFVWDNNMTADTTDISAPNVKQEATTEAPVNTTSETEGDIKTVGWKTYTNTAEYYSFKYPAEWKIDAKGGVDPATGVPAFTASCTYEAGDTCLIVDMYGVSRVWTGTLQAYVNEFLAGYSSPAVAQSKTTLGGEDAVKVVLQKVSGGEIHYVVAIHALHNGKSFTLVATEQTKPSATAPKVFQNMAIIDSVATSFKFTK